LFKKKSKKPNKKYEPVKKPKDDDKLPELKLEDCDDDLDPIILPSSFVLHNKEKLE